MKCPACGHPDTKVIDSRLTREGSSIRRRRACESCGRRFTTYERIEESMPLVIKKDGSREVFSREKVQVGIQKALEKRPVTAEEREALVDRVEKYVLERGEKEIASQVVGERVMEELRRLDQVAYVRFASVYRSFRDLEDFVEEVQKLRPPADRPAASGPAAASAGEEGEEQ
ncbi:MAG: transcriptional regulator NrdR [Nitrospinota bacterium]